MTTFHHHFLSCREAALSTKQRRITVPFRRLRGVVENSRSCPNHILRATTEVSGWLAPRTPASCKLPANPAGLISASAAVSRRDGQNKEDAMKTPIARQKIEKARELLHNQNTDIKTIQELAEELIREREFGYAR